MGKDDNVSDDGGVPMVSPELELTALEQLALTAFQLVMMDADIEAESSSLKIELKTRDRDREVLRATEVLRALPQDLPGWAAEFRNSVDAGNPHAVYEAFRSAGWTFGTHVRPRPRAMMVLIDCVMFDPWSGKSSWDSKTRDKQLSVIEKYLPDLEPSDLGTIQREYVTAITAVRRRSTTLGDTATRALGKLPNSVGETLTNAAVWLKSLNADVVASAVRADLITRLVVIQAENDEEKAKRVIQSMQERLAVVAEKQVALAEKLRESKQLNRLLGNENRELRQQLREERERAEIAESALRAALDHIHGAIPATQGESR